MAEDITVIRTEPNGYALGLLEVDGTWVVYYRDSESSTWTKYQDVTPFVDESQARSWIEWLTIMPFRRP